MKHLLPMLLTSAAIALPLLPCTAATLRPITTLDSDSVRLSDLFDDAGAEATRVLGPAPTPGNRLVVEAAQLGAIARQFGVAWRPASPADRIVLDRPGRLLPREAMMTALRRALDDAGAPQGEIELAGYAPPLVGIGSAAPQAMFEQLDYDAGSGRFSGVMAVAAPGETNAAAQARIRLSGTLQELVALPVLVRRLIPGSVIQPADIQIVRLRTGLTRGAEVAHTAEDAIGMAVRHMTLAGQPLVLADLARPPTIAKGTRVRMRLQAGGLQLAADGLALEPGSLGERIRVLNPISRAIVEADITGPEDVSVAAAGTAQAATEARLRTPDGTGNGFNSTQFAARTAP